VGMSDEAKKELDAHINEHSEERAKANAAELAYQARLKERLKERRGENKREWIAYYKRLQLVHQQRVDEVTRRLAELQRLDEED
jgi:hypothetical protein